MSVSKVDATRLPLKDNGLALPQSSAILAKVGRKPCNLPKSTAVRCGSVAKGLRPRPRLPAGGPTASHSGNSLQSTLETDRRLGRIV